MILESLDRWSNLQYGEGFAAIDPVSSSGYDLFHRLVIAKSVLVEECVNKNGYGDKTPK